MILKIQIGTDNKILRQKAEKVKQITAEIKQLVLNMIETLQNNNGAGLAAPQVNQPLRIIIVKPDLNMEPLVLINPEIKKFSRKKSIMIEGCLSLPNTEIPIERVEKIKVEALNLDDKKITLKAKGILARVIQHEIDHLDGILIYDKL